MIHSDLYLTPTLKIEILPSDSITHEKGLISQGDQLFGVFRGVGGTYLAETLRMEYATYLKEYVCRDGLSIDSALQEVVDNMSLVCVYEAKDRDFDTIKQEGAMLLVVYLSPNEESYFVQVGNITLKQKVNNKFVTLTKDHTFDNLEELNEIVSRKLHGEYLGDYSANDHLNFIALKCFDIPDPENRIGKGLLLPKIPSRFIGHISYCGILNDQDTWLINTKPYVGKFRL